MYSTKYLFILCGWQKSVGQKARLNTISEYNNAQSENAPLDQFYRHMEDIGMTNGKSLCMYIHIQPPYIIIHTVYIVPVRSC